MFIFLIYSLLSTAWSVDLKEKTFKRDSTACRYQSVRFKFQLRSTNQFTEVKDKYYGEYLSFGEDETNIEQIDINKDQLHTYRFFKGQNSLCSKSYGFQLNENLVAILLQKENKPFKDKLSILVFDFKNKKKVDFIETDFPVKEAEPVNNGFIFEVIPEKSDTVMGKLTFNAENFRYQDQTLSIWYRYDLKNGTVPAPDITFAKLRFKKGFKDINDFLEASAWSASENKFKKTIIYHAFNMGLTHQCVFFSAEKIKPTGQESGWRCY
jgi:hypothetical protein